MAQGDNRRKCVDGRGKPIVGLKAEAAVERSVDQVAIVHDNYGFRPSSRGSNKQRPEASETRGNVCWLGQRRRIFPSHPWPTQMDRNSSSRVRVCHMRKVPKPGLVGDSKA